MSSKIKHYCDRCGKEITFETSWILNFKWESKFALRYLKPNWNYCCEIEMCQECGKEFELFLKEGKGNE